MPYTQQLSGESVKACETRTHKKGGRMSLRRIAATTLGAVLVGTAAAAPLTTGAFAAVSPGQVLISDTTGVIWSYDISDGALEMFADVTPGNYDIAYTGPNELLISNVGDLCQTATSGALYTLDLRTLDESLLLQDDELQAPIGAAVTPRGGGVTYVTDFCSQSTYRLSSGSSTLEWLADVGDNLGLDRRGTLYFAGGEDFGRIIMNADGAVAETIATVENAWLTGFVISPQGIAYVADNSPVEPAVHEIDVATGEVLATYTSPEVRSPGDVALAPTGDLYVVNAALPEDPANLTGIYRIPAGSTTMEAVYQGQPLGDPVDMLLTPFQGF